MIKELTIAMILLSGIALGQFEYSGYSYGTGTIDSYYENNGYHMWYPFFSYDQYYRLDPVNYAYWGGNMQYQYPYQTNWMNNPYMGW